jgi:hypothetical protein
MSENVKKTLQTYVEGSFLRWARQKFAYGSSHGFSPMYVGTKPCF